MMTFRGQGSMRLWVVALGAAVLLGYFGVPVAGAYLYTRYEWLPTNGAVEGLIGSMIGLASIFFVGGVATLGQRFEANPLDPRSPK